MHIGIISDTHNDIEATEKALEILAERNVDTLVHAGDINSPRMLEFFKGLDCYIVLGNGDLIDKDEIRKKGIELGMRPAEEKLEFSLGGKRFAVFHGHDVPLFRETVSSGNYDYIIKGHTHFFENYVNNYCRIINPGALYRRDESSFAILDIETDKVEKIIIDEL
jgi:putative phosphoesterase